MPELKEILLHHAKTYPLMQPTDAVKLLYQNEFGGGHLIQDEAACLSYLRREYNATPQANISLLEDIGNGMVRVQLAGLDACGCSPEQLGEAFLRSASLVSGSPESFLQKLSVLKDMTQAGQMPFSSHDLAMYLIQYKSAGYPAVSHSELYRNTYRPAYRVLSVRCLPPLFPPESRSENME